MRSHATRPPRGQMREWASPSYYPAAAWGESQHWLLPTVDRSVNSGFNSSRQGSVGAIGIGPPCRLPRPSGSQPRLLPEPISCCVCWLDHTKSCRRSANHTIAPAQTAARCSSGVCAIFVFSRWAPSRALLWCSVLEFAICSHLTLLRLFCPHSVVCSLRFPAAALVAASGLSLFPPEDTLG